MDTCMNCKYLIKIEKIEDDAIRVECTESEEANATFDTDEHKCDYHSEV